MDDAVRDMAMIVEAGAREAIAAMPQIELLHPSKASLLRDLADLYTNHLVWAYMEDDCCRSLRSGTGEFLLVIVPDNQTHQLSNPSSFQVSWRKSITIFVRTVPLTSTWAALGLFHELNHALEYGTGREPKDSSRSQFMEGEVRSFLFEIALADALSDGRFLAIVEDAFTKYRVVLPEHGPWLSAALDRAFEVPPAGAAERSLRDALYQTAFKFRRMGQPLGSYEMASYVAELEQAYENAGVLHDRPRHDPPSAASR